MTKPTKTAGIEYLAKRKKMKKSNWHGGKGSGRRSSQDDSKYADNWEKIFGKHRSNINTSNKNVTKNNSSTPKV